MVVFALYGVAVLLVLAPIGVALGASPRGTSIVYGASLIVTLILCTIALVCLFEQPLNASIPLPLGLPGLGAHFRIDALAAFFLIVVNLGGASASLFALGYGRHEHSPQRVLPFYPVYLAGMNLVILADDAFSFLVSWEFMSLTSWALVVAHHRVSENVRAGYVYLLMASFGTLMLLLAFGLLAGTDGNYAFEAIRLSHPSAVLTALVLVLTMLGAGSKAGVVPLHAWLPLAHPAAPSHVSALMSGVMTKVAVYGTVRILFDLLGPPAWWWSMLVLAIGGITAVMGVLYALMQHDLKRLLAYHTVENIGIIYIGVGLALAFKAYGMPVAAALALTAGLFHVFNHSIFKSLLFFGAGAVLNATGERDMEHLGGLIHRMPQVAFVFLVGCVAISALPPLNGFASEWLTIVPIAESRSSYNGLLVFIFVTLSGSSAAFAIHRLASDKLRRGPAWDCGYPDPSPVTQYTASSFAQPIRRVYGTTIFRAREIGEIPPPGATAPARLTVQLHDPIWDTAYAPIGGFVGFTANKLNVLQFLTVRRYLTLVFTALVLLLLVLAIWS